jgi:hypothetical protein
MADRRPESAVDRACARGSVEIVEQVGWVALSSSSSLSASSKKVAHRIPPTARCVGIVPRRLSRRCRDWKVRLAFSNTARLASHLEVTERQVGEALA